MYCQKCGTQLDENNVCPKCDGLNLEAILSTPAAEKKYSGKAIASFVLSLVGILVFGLICGILGVIFSTIAMREIETNKNLSGKGLATSGLVISIIDIVFVLIYLF